MENLSIIGSENVAKLINAVTDKQGNAIQILITVDAFQSTQDDSKRSYNIDIINIDFEGIQFVKTEEE